MKNDRPAKCEQKISTLNVTSGRSAKCKKKSTPNVKKVLVSWMTNHMVSLANLVGQVSFFGILGVRGVKMSNIKHSGKCHDVQRNCREGNKQGKELWGFLGVNIKKCWKY